MKNRKTYYLKARIVIDHNQYSQLALTYLEMISVLLGTEITLKPETCVIGEDGVENHFAVAYFYCKTNTLRRKQYLYSHLKNAASLLNDSYCFLVAISEQYPYKVDL